jgi:hypothetical protein
MSESGSEVEEEYEPIMPERGVGIVCGLRLSALEPLPVLYFGDETHACGVGSPVSPRNATPLKSGPESGRMGSNNPLNSIIRRWEAKFARHGGFMEESGCVSSSARNDGRYYEADEWLDDGNDEGDEGEEDQGDFDPAAFRAIDTPDNIEEELDETPSVSEAENETSDETEEIGGNCETLLKRLDPYKQPVIKDLITEMEQVQAFPGHTKQKKQKSLRDCTSKLRRLLPKVSHVQSQWQAAVWDVVNLANPNTYTMQFFIDLWNDVSVAKQREEFSKDQLDCVFKLVTDSALKELISAWKKGEAVTRSRFEQTFNRVAKLWDVWVQEEECAGRVVPSLSPPSGGLSRIEKRFTSHLTELVPALSESAVSSVIFRMALFGSRKTKNKPLVGSTVELSGTVVEDEVPSVALPDTSVSLPVTIFLYKRNELLKCKLIDIKSLAIQTIQVVDKDWLPPPDASSPQPASVEFTSLTTLFESYQQKFVRKQDRIKLASQYDGWKNFAIKTNTNEYVYLYDIASKAALANTYGFTDKSGNPIYLPPLSAVRNADAERQKKLNQAKEERKRKREAQLEFLRTEPPFSDNFIPFPLFSKSLFAVETPEIVKPPDSIN